jgi:hypothetical protein
MRPGSWKLPAGRWIGGREPLRKAGRQEGLIFHPGEAHSCSPTFLSGPPSVSTPAVAEAHGLRHGAVGIVLLVAALASACGTTASQSLIHHPLLPIEARRRVADGEDGVTIAKAARADAIRDRDAVKAWRDRLLKEGSWGKDAPQDLLKALREMTGARLEVQRLLVEKTEAELGVARAKHELAAAEVQVQHDLDVYDLGDYEQGLEAARAELRLRARAVEDKRLLLEKAGAAWWNSYADYLRNGGDRLRLWTAGSPDQQKGEAPAESANGKQAAPTAEDR